jgi:formylglycine-generating enzyme
VGPLLVARAPVLEREWLRVPGAPPLAARRGDALPVSGLTWRAARAWCALAGLRLPTEAEWEMIARAGTSTAYPWGDDPRGLWSRDTAGGRPHDPEERASFANAFDLVDVCGNVAEPCEDDLVLAMEGSAWQEWDPGKVVRGGSWDRPASHARTSWRDGVPPDRLEPDLGLRPAWSVECTT